MKDLMKRVSSFITFDSPLQTECISAQFANTHTKLLTEIPGWSTTATLQKLISKYWFTYVAGHFAMLFVSSVVSVFLWHGFGQPTFYMSSVFVSGLLIYPILYLFHYQPYYSSIFLPRLETVKENYERKQIERLEKCRQAQLSNFALALVFYVFDKSASINSLQCNDQSAELMMRLYGIDKGSIKKNLELIIGKRKNLPTRKMTEIQNRFAEAYLFFEELKFPKGVHILQCLETRFSGQLNQDRSKKQEPSCLIAP